jgi:hypothetical protein
MHDEQLASALLRSIRREPQRPLHADSAKVSDAQTAVSLSTGPALSAVGRTECADARANPATGDTVASYAVALGRAATTSYQRFSARISVEIGISNARVAKSTVTKLVMSAAEKSSPATNGASANHADISP